MIPGGANKEQILESLAEITNLIERAFSDGQRVAIHGEIGTFLSGHGPPAEDGRRPILRDWDGSLAYLVFIGPRPPKTGTPEPEKAKQ